jgi:hypothetical protein
MRPLWISFLVAIVGAQTVQWKSLSSLPPQRYGAATTFANDSFFLFGGVSSTDSAALDDLWLFSSTQWTQVLQLLQPSNAWPKARAFAGATSLGDDVFLFGGCCQQNSSNFDDLWRFSLKALSFSLISSPGASPPGRVQFGFVTLSPPQLLIFGGRLSSDDASSTIVTNDMWVFNFTTASWSLYLPLLSPAARLSPALAARGPVALLFGGFGLGGALSDLWLFASFSNVWTPIQSNPSPPHAFGATVLFLTDSTVFFYGGLNSNFSALNFTAALNISSTPPSLAKQPVFAGPPSSSYVGAALVAPSRIFFPIFASGAAGYFFDPPSSAWTTVPGPPPLPAMRAASMAAYEGAFMMFGGLQGASTVNSVFYLGSEGGVWIQIPTNATVTPPPPRCDAALYALSPVNFVYDPPPSPLCCFMQHPPPPLF